MHAFLAAEDSKFFEHGGIDVLGLGRAMANERAQRLARGGGWQGGSTITQQVAKNVLLTNEVTINRKIKEAILSSRLEETLTKDQHPRALSERDLAGPIAAYGVGPAAYNYFGKSLNQTSAWPRRPFWPPCPKARQL